MAPKDSYLGNEKILWKSIKENKIGKLYLFFGPEEYLIRNYCEQMEKRLLEEEFRLLNKVVLNEKATPAQIMENCLTYPVFSDRRLVIVRDSGLFRSGRKSDDTGEAGEDAGKKAKGTRSRGKDADELSEFLQFFLKQKTAYEIST